MEKKNKRTSVLSPNKFNYNLELFFFFSIFFDMLSARQKVRDGYVIIRSKFKIGEKLKI